LIVSDAHDIRLINEYARVYELTETAINVVV